MAARYWIGGTNTWNQSTGNWSATSGGTSGASTPTLDDDVYFDANSVGTVTVSGAKTVKSINFTGFTGTFTGTEEITVYGNITLSAGMTFNHTGLISIAANCTLITAGKTLGSFRVLEGITQLGDSLICSGSGTLTTGTFDAVTYNVTLSNFISTTTNVRSLKLGSGLWTITGTSTVWGITNTNLDYWMGTADILFSNTSTSLRVFDGGGLSYNKVTIGGATGVSTFNLNGNNSFGELASTKTVAHTIALGTTTQAFGKWSVTGSAGAVVTLTGTTTSLILAGDATENIDYLAMGSVGFSANSPAEFYAGANSTGTATSPVFRTAKPAARTLYWVGGTGNWSATTNWSLSSGGAGGESPPTSLDDVIFNSASNATAYTSTIDTHMRVRSLTIAGPASGNVTLAGSARLSLHQSISYPATGFTFSYYGEVQLSGTGSGKTIATNGRAIGGTITLIGYNSSWSLQSASGGSLQLRFGELSTNGYSYSCEFFGTQNESWAIHRTTLNLGSSTISVSGFSTPIALGGDFGAANRNNVTFNAGTSTVNFTSSQYTNANINISNKTFNILNITFNSGINSGYLRTINLSGSGTFNELKITRDAGWGTNFVDFYGNLQFGNLSVLGTAYSDRTELRSSSLGVTRTVTVTGTVSLPDCDFRDLTFTGASAPITPTRGGNCGNNSGITFPAAKTVYRVGDTSTVYWPGTNAWALTSGGTGSNANFPLAQDTVIIDDNSGSGNLYDIRNYNMGNWDFSQRTVSKSFLFQAGHTFHGNITQGSGLTLVSSISSTQTFVNASPITIISAGKTFPLPIAITTRSKVTLGDALTVTDTLTHNFGEFDASSYNLTVTKFFSNNSNVRTIKLGSGTWTMTGTGTGAASPWDINNPANLTLDKGTATLLFSDTSTTTREFRGGTLAYPKLTIGGTTGISDFRIGGTNSFTEITSTKTVAHTITFQNNQNIIDTWNVKGTAGNLVSLRSSTAGTRRLFNLTNITLEDIDYLDVKDIGVNQTGKLFVGVNSVNSGNNLNVYFSLPMALGSGGSFLSLL